jgi:hypothetical protein
MSDLLNSASLVMIPSGYKEDVVYSPIPTDGSGDLSFTRASNGTRVNSAGLVEVTPWNLVQNSENFDAVWTKYNGATVTTNAIVAPNGTTTADLLIAGASQEVYSANMPKVAEELYYTFSCYAKLYNTNVFKITASDFSTSGVDASFNLSTLSATYVTGATWSNTSVSIESVGNGWYRCILTSKSPATTGLYLSLYTSGTNSVSGVYIWGAQVNIGSTAKPYFPTTDRLNVPRLTYQNGGGGCPSLLLEKQSTNTITYSEQFDNAAWTKNVSVTANAITSPDGTQNADKILESASNVQQWAYQSPSMTGAQAGTIYAKKGERNYIAMATAGLDPSYFNLDTGVVVSSASGATASIENVGNGWYKCSVSSPSIVGGTYFIVWISDNGTRTSYAGDSSKGVYVWGAQNEASSYPTSYISTTSASATRVADACYKTGISSLIGQTEGVLFADFSTFVGANDDRQISINDGSVSNRVTMALLTNGTQIQFVVQSGGSIVMNTTQTIATLTTRVKIAYAYKLNDFAIYVNGVSVATDTNGAVPISPSVLSFDAGDSTDKMLGKVNQVALFPTRLTNAELASLTTL